MKISYERGTIILDKVTDYTIVPDCFIWDSRVDKHRTLAYNYRKVVEFFFRKKIPYTDKVKSYRELNLKSYINLEPHTHQKESVHTWLKTKRGSVILPTGSGKTYVAKLIIHKIQRSTLIVVPTIDLMNQWYDFLSLAFKEEVGLIGGGYYEIKDLTVTTYDSAYIKMDSMGNRFGLIIFDEVHHLPGETFIQSAEMCIAPYRLGLTATYDRQDNRHLLLEEVIGPVVYEKKITELVQEDLLAEYETKRIIVGLCETEQLEYREARKVVQEFREEKGLYITSPKDWQKFILISSRSAKGREAMFAHQKARKIALGTESKISVLDSLLRKHSKDRILIFTHDNEMVYIISKRCLIPSITHQTDSKERKEILEKFNEGTYKALVTSKVLNEGVNVPKCNVGIVFSGSSTVREHVQRLGRILRKVEGKKAILYELVSRGTVEEHSSRRRREHSAYKRSG
ncbi:MAG TPA: DEAD/DEAH box helicase family protein [Candidatus Eremiobacteraeota bacterium]|nr:MAG: excinuclease ABC subunit B [bacterium ADurb.Bin363]HPZ09528.1 DEAD/DEAH box helicase family protein [Candidatus Eremiobacteraeota bacterium]